MITKSIKYNLKKIRIREIDAKGVDWKKKAIKIKKIENIILEADYIKSLIKYKEESSKE